jgi:hypothetical protein
MKVRAIVIVAGLLAGCGWARADDPVSVTSLLKQGFDVVAVIPSPAGPGLFMRKADKLIACFVSETPTSTTISTRYCKPVE